MGHSLLIIESSATPAEASAHAALGSDTDFQCEQLSWDGFAPETLARKAPRAVVAVAVPQGAAVTNVFRWLCDNAIPTPTVAVLAADAGEPLVQLASQAADDFLFAPVRASELRHRLLRVLGPARSELEALHERLLEEMAMTQLVGRDPVFLQAIEQVPRFARSGLPVLITGETGTGKELCARALHHLGPRRDFPFIAVDCGALPDHLVENELFGHARGAYTDAHRDQRGLISMAEGGTLFLDEIDALSPTAQGKLLRFLQERTYRPLGADRFKSVNVNVMAATNLDLETAVAAKQFRPDLFYRLNVLRLHLPALRDRSGDIRILAAHFLSQSLGCGAHPGVSFSPAALRVLVQHQWHGNVRELANVVERAAVLCDGSQVLPRHVILSQPSGAAADGSMPFHAARAAAVATFERSYIEELLVKHGGNVTRAARAAGKDRRVFGRLMKKHGIRR